MRTAVTKRRGGAAAAAALSLTAVLALLLGTTATTASASRGSASTRSQKAKPTPTPAPSSSSSPSSASPALSPGLNWAGYLATPSQPVTAVSTQFAVPTVNGLGPGFVGEWAGIGGATSDDLLQAGAAQEYVPGSGVVYYAWWEALPAYEQQLDTARYPVSPGDAMTVSISNKGGNTWSVQMADPTKGWTFSTSVSYASSKSSAEWIVEAPEMGLAGLPIGVQTVPPTMSTATFDGSSNSATVGGQSHLLGSVPGLTELAVSVATVLPSAIDADGDGFNVCEYQVTCSPPAS